VSDEGRKEKSERERGREESPTSIVRLTGRDNEPMGHVATAGFLTLRELKRIVFVRSLTRERGTGASGKERTEIVSLGGS